MPTTLTFFPVDNGDMTLITLFDHAATTILIDVNVRTAADNPDDNDTPDVMADLRGRINRDAKGRPYVDVFMLSHPDLDHCRGLDRHFHLGKLEDYPDDKKPDGEKKIVIREIWSSPIVFRRRSSTHKLSDDAAAFNCEAKRRVKLNKETFCQVQDGDRVRILGEDINGKTDGIPAIVTKVGDELSMICGRDFSSYFKARLLAPLDSQDDPELEANFSKNHSSVIMNFMLWSGAMQQDGVKFLTGGDAEVLIWSRLWDQYKDTPEVLEYDVLQTPHHCSWHSLSYDSWSKNGNDAKVDENARNALGQARDGAVIVASCKPIADDDCDPPCMGAKDEYEAIADEAGGTFICTGEYPDPQATKSYVLTVTADGAKKPTTKDAAAKLAGLAGTASVPMPHG